MRTVVAFGGEYLGGFCMRAASASERQCKRASCTKSNPRLTRSSTICRSPLSEVPCSRRRSLAVCFRHRELKKFSAALVQTRRGGVKNGFKVPSEYSHKTVFVAPGDSHVPSASPEKNFLKTATVFEGM